MRYARIDAGRVAEIVTLPDLGIPDPETGEVRPLALADCYHPDLAARMVACGPEVGEGWVYTGGTFAPPSAPVTPVPAEVALFKARFVMRRTAAPKGGGTLLDAAMAAIAAIKDEAVRALALEAMEYAPTISRRGVLVQLLAPTLGLDDEALDDLFRDAQAIQA